MMRRSHLFLKIFLQGKLIFLTASNPEMILRCLLSPVVFRRVTARTEKIVCWCLRARNQ